MADTPPGNGTRWRLEDHERRLQNIERSTEDLAVVKERVSRVQRTLESDIRNEFKSVRSEIHSGLASCREETVGLRRMFLAAAVSVATAAVGSSLFVFMVFR